MARKRANVRRSSARVPARTAKRRPTPKSARPSARSSAKPARAVAKPAGKPRRSAPTRNGRTPNRVTSGLEYLEWSHATTIALLSDWPLERLTFQSAPGDNHALWTIGHLATTYAWFASLLDGHMTPLPENYNLLFGTGSKPVDDSLAYPPMGEVRHHFDAAYARLAELGARLKAGDASKATVGNAHGFCKDRADVLVKAAWHEGWHSGQLSTLRRALGLTGIM